MDPGPPIHSIPCRGSPLKEGFPSASNGFGSLKNRFPFRTGATSYIIPAELLPNVNFLAGKVDDIELVLFESDEITNLPETATVKALNKTADRIKSI
jgi:hypothetical protein